MSALVAFLWNRVTLACASGALAIALAFTSFNLVVTSQELKASRDSEKAALVASGRDAGTLAQLSADSARRVTDAQAATAAANQRAAQAQRAAASLQAATPADPNDLCGSASKLIRETLTQEKP